MNLFGYECIWMHMEYWWSFIVAFVLFLFVLSAYMRRCKAVALLSHVRHRLLLFPYYSVTKERVRLLLWALALFFFCIALLGPAWDKKEESVEQQGRELFIALDVSRSMLAADLLPNRLEFAKAKIKRLLQLLPAERVGLVIFAGTAVVQCPLTRDATLLRLFLDQLDAQTISSGTTALDTVIKMVMKLFDSLGARKNKIVVVFTDGEDFSEHLKEVKEEARKSQVHIFTYGVGTAAGAPVPQVNAQGDLIGYEKTAQGTVIFSSLCEDVLKGLSQETGALYISPTQTDADLKELVACVERYEKESLGNQDLEKYEERYPLALAFTFGALLIEWLL